MAVEIQNEPTLKATTPRMLFEKTGYGVGTRQYDVAPDGQRFLMLKQSGEVTATPPQIVVVKNWFEELKRLVPTK